MQLKEFSLISPSIEAQEIFQAIQTVIPPEAIGDSTPVKLGAIAIKN
ncbi:MAG: hypothetical protein AB4368_08705 [Xenococcaceae cyanobacterium]